MKLSKDGFDRLSKHEGVRYQVYDDSNGRVVSSYSEVMGYPTIGIGHLITQQERDKYARYLKGVGEMSHRQVYNLFLDDVPKYYAFVTKLTAPITQAMFDSMVSLSFNTGNSSRTVKSAIEKINARNYIGASDAIASGISTSKGITRQGLVKRRLDEAQLFLADGLPKSFWLTLLFFAGVGGTVYYFKDEIKPYTSKITKYTSKITKKLPRLK